MQSIPGKTFTGEIDYLDPIIDPVSRVAHARISVANPDLKFKPEMFVSGVVNSALSEDEDAIVVPKTAVMWTGTRSIVYVKKSTTEGLTFQLREVTLGAALGADYIITSGLRVGEEIVVNGAFSVDAAAQLAGKPSMMSPEGGVASSGHNHGEISKANQKEFLNKIPLSKTSKTDMTQLFEHYFKFKNALVNDDLLKAKSTAAGMLKSLSKFEQTSFEEKVRMDWSKYHGVLSVLLEKVNSQNSLTDVRKIFLSISGKMISIAETFNVYTNSLYVQRCPMANANKGAIWLSKHEEVLNPYFGEAMLACGEVIKKIR